LTDGDSDAPSSGGKITRSMNFARGSYVCETPALIEQRLFALARVIQHNLD